MTAENILYDTHILLGVAERVRVFPRFFLNHFFNVEYLHATEQILIDKVDDTLPTLAPFVHPRAEAPNVETAGYSTDSLKPAYIKMKHRIDPHKALKRLPGEAIGGSLSIEQRKQRLLKDHIANRMEMYLNRLEVMASEVLRTGKLHVKGEGFDEIIDYKRNKDLDETLEGQDQWTNADVDIFSQLEDRADKVYQLSGKTVSAFIMGTKAYGLLKKSKIYQKTLDLRRGVNQDIPEFTPTYNKDGLMFRGNLGEYPIFTYQAEYVDPLNDKEVSKVVKDFEVLILSEGCRGERHFGAILDEDAPSPKMEYFIKSWKQEDPSGRVTLFQSSPLLAVRYPNATMRLTVVKDPTEPKKDKSVNKRKSEVKDKSGDKEEESPNRSNKNKDQNNGLAS